MDDQESLTEKSEICRLLPCLGEKFVVDFANGIDVARDHQRVQRGRTGFFPRLWDGITGKASRRQGEIGASVIDGVEGALQWLTELSNSLATSNLAIGRINDRVNELKLDVADIANFSADTREQLERLAIHIDERCNFLAEELERIDLVQRATISLDHVFSKWSAGRYASYSLPARCYAALEELRWGRFGDYIRYATPVDSQPFIDDLVNKISVQLAHESGGKVSQRMNTREHWLLTPTGNDSSLDSGQALAYLGDWSAPDASPFVFTASQLPDELPIALPRLCSAVRISEAMVYEVFEDDTHG